MPNSNSSGSTASNATKSSGRWKKENPSPVSHQVEYELNKDGELVPISNDSDMANDLKVIQEQSMDQNVDIKTPLESGGSSSSRNKRKQTFERKNIK